VHRLALTSSRATIYYFDLYLEQTMAPKASNLSGQQAQEQPTWQNFQTEAQLVLGTANENEDNELLEALNDLEDVPEPAEDGEDDSQTDLMIRYIATVLDRAGDGRRADGFDARTAIMALIDNNWNLEQVFEQFEAEDEIDQGRGRESPSVSTDGNGVQTVETYETMMRRMNPDVDRMPAMQNGRDDRKLTITLHRQNKNDLNARFKDSARMNWTSSNMIHALNKWRGQYFRRHLGLVSTYRPPFHPEEIDWLTTYHRLAKAEADEAGEAPNFRFNWNEVEHDFNHQFEGMMLKGETNPRPKREKSSLLRQRYRIPEVKKILENAGEKEEEDEGKGKQKKDGESSKKGGKK